MPDSSQLAAFGSKNYFMTVKELKKILRSTPDWMEIMVQDHDHDVYEYNGRLKSAQEIDYSKKPFDKETYFKEPEGKVLMLRIG